MNLTPRQKQCLDFLAAYIKAHGVSPTFRDVMLALGFKSTAAVACILQALEGKGYISRTRQQRRGLRLLFSPADTPDWQGIALTLNEENAALRKRLAAAGQAVPKPKVILCKTP